MDNPEEVLHALDEFQKIRPTEIPRELEDYLCFVAKTGDPVYQWNLIKALFREKLTKVMTEFYESCPSPDPALCPNVDQFNYDIMKTNLLDRLENFANAPFTVQRICELLTAPRKEYNRIDKFMRAIEKNILVVSTKDPGSLSRRSENGDSLINGSMEDENSHHGLSSEVETWEKACTESAVLLQMGSNEELNLERIDNVQIKNSFVKSENITSLDGTSSTFITSTGDYPVSQVLLSEVSSVVQNLTTINNESSTTSIVGDISDAVISEDTNSQPSLELENDGNISNDTKKLQTIFQSKDFNVGVTDPMEPFAEENNDYDGERSNETIETKLDVSNQQSTQSYSSEELFNERASNPKNILIDKSDHSNVSKIENEKKIELEINKMSEYNSNININDSQLIINIGSEIQKNALDDLPKTSIGIVIDPEYTEEKNISIQKDVEIMLNIPVLTKTTETLKKTSESDKIKKLSESTSTSNETTTELEKSMLTIAEAMENDLKAKIFESKFVALDEGQKYSKPSPISVSGELVPEVIESSSKVENSLENTLPQIVQVEDNHMQIHNCDVTPMGNTITEWMDVDNETLHPSPLAEQMEQEIVNASNS